MTRYRMIIGLVALGASSGAAAQWVPGSEITGQTVEVQSGTHANLVEFEPGGTARITTPRGSVRPATWTASERKLCIGMGAKSECVPYATPFEAGVPLDMVSDCGSRSRWLAKSVNPAPPSRLGERG